MKKIALLSIIALTGCAPYQSKITIQTPQGSAYKVALPKDAKFRSLHVSVPTTNGPVSLEIEEGEFKMNPVIIDSKTAHDVAVIGAVVNGISTVGGAAAGAMVKP